MALRHNPLTNRKGDDTMTVQKNKELIHRYVEEVHNQQDLDIISEFVDEDDLEDGIDHLRQFFTAFPDNHTTVLDLFGEREKIVARLRVKGTNEGPFAGQPAIGNRIQFDSIRIYRIVDDKIVETWAMQDRLGLMEQLDFVRAAGEVNWGAGEDEPSWNR
jgi:predicted ester cyclase